MKTKKRILYTSVAILTVGWSVRASDVSTSQKRMQTVELASSLLAPRVYNDSPESINSRNPFVPKRAVEAPVESVRSAAPVSDRELLARISDGFTPSGTIVLGDTPLLLAGQKRLKVGDVVSIMFQGAAYQVQIVGIDRTSYTLRLNNEEITRPIKSSK